MAETFPRQYARTRRFTLGAPRSFAVAPDGSRVAFLRSDAGDDPVQALWVLDLTSGDVRKAADPRQLAGDEHDLPPEERARRERARESATGIVSYATDRDVRVAAFTLGGRLFTCGLDSDGVHHHDVPGPVVDPRPAPAGEAIAYVHDQALHVLDRSSGDVTRVAADDEADVSWGLPEFVAAEEMGRVRGHWWSPQGDRLAVTRVDVRPVQTWHLADPAQPTSAPVTLRYPAAGTANADVRLAVVHLHGRLVWIEWDHQRMPYLVDVVWTPHGPLTLVVQSRDQRVRQVLRAQPDTGRTSVVSETVDPCWVDLVPGVPRWMPGERLVDTVDDEDTRRLTIAGVPVTPRGLQVRRLVNADGDGVVFAASQHDPAAISVWRIGADGTGLHALTPVDGVHDGAGRGLVTVLVSRDLASDGADTRVVTPHGEHRIASHAHRPIVRAHAQLHALGARRLRSALLVPSGWHPGAGRLPVLLDPYGGPHSQRVLAHQGMFLVPQWFADQGFAVLVADGRGTPGRGPAWERVLAGDLATAPLEDQVEALHAAADVHDFLDLERVAIRGWSFGGFLAALAVLRRPDVFHAAIAGAPVTDWHLYDTHYTERYLGIPAERPHAYTRSSLLADAQQLRRPLLLIHGLSDDNVVAAHTLRLSQALLEAGRPHTVLPLSGVTHMTPQEVVAENLLLLQLAFLRDALRLQDEDHEQ